MTKEEAKAAFKEAIKEWLDEKYANFGKWALRSIGAAALGALTYFILVNSGWHK